MDPEALARKRYSHRRLPVQYAVTRALSEGADLNEVAPKILEIVGEALEWDLGVFWCVDRQARVLRCEAIWPEAPATAASFAQETCRMTPGPGETFGATVWQAATPRWIERVARADGLVDPRLAATPHMMSAMAFPILLGPQVLGVVEFFSHRVRPLDHDLLEMMALIGSQIGQFIDRREAEQAVRQSEARKRAILESALDPIITTDEHGVITEFNPAAERTFGYTRDDAIGHPLKDLVRGDAILDLDGYFGSLTGTSPAMRLELTGVRSDGTEFPVELTITRVDVPGPAMFTGYVRDMSERRRAEEEIAYLAFHDKLTGLPNRAMLEELLEMAVARARRHDLAVSVLYMDVDNLKLVNDSLGHAAGDELLREVGLRLREASRDEDAVARIGGDEFLLLLGDLPTRDADGSPSGEEALRVAESVAQRIQDVLARPFEIAGTEFYVSASIGISIFPQDAEDARTLLRNADAAMYRSKRTGRGGYVVYAQEAGDPLSRLSFSTRLRTAVEGKHWELHYQPIVELIEGTMVGVEALLRWRDPQRGLISPDDFVPLAEEIGVIEAIGEWVLEELSSQWARWGGLGVEIDVSFNLSPRQLWYPDLVGKVIDNLQRAGMDGNRMIVEVTESTVMTDPERTSRILRELNERGLRVAIDDFGMGYSSLSRLKQLPVDILKLDRFFLQGIPDDGDARSMLRSMIQLAHSLGMAPLVEGVESEDQLSFVVDRGCPLGQGYLFSPPVPAEQIPEMFGRPLIDLGSTLVGRLEQVL